MIEIPKIYHQQLYKRVAAIVCAASVAVAASVPGVIPGIVADQASAETVKDEDGTTFSSFEDQNGTGARLILGLGGRSFGQLYWLDYSGMKTGYGVNDTDGPIGQARAGKEVPMKFVIPMEGASGTDGNLTIELSMTFEGVKPVLRHPLAKPEEDVRVQFQPMGTRRWGAFGAHTTNKDLQATKDPFKNNYRLPADAQTGLGYPDAVPNGNEWAKDDDPVTFWNDQADSRTSEATYNTTVRYSGIKVTDGGDSAPEYAVVFSDMEATDVKNVETYDVSVDDFGKSSAKYPLVRFGELYTDEVNHGRESNENPWPQYNANRTPCVDENGTKIETGTTIKCEAVDYDADAGTGPGGVMFSARQAKQLAFKMTGERANAYGIGFLLPYSDGTVEVKNGSGETAVPTDKQSNFDLTVKVGADDEGSKVVTTASDKPVHVTNNKFIKTNGKGEGVVEYSSNATADKPVNGVYTPKWTCRKNSIDANGNNATAEVVDVKKLGVTTVDKDGKISSKVEVPVDNSTTSVSCDVVWTGKVEPKPTPTVTTVVTTTETTTVTTTASTPTVTPAEPTPVTVVTTVTGTPPTDAATPTTVTSTSTPKTDEPGSDKDKDKPGTDKDKPGTDEDKPGSDKDKDNPGNTPVTVTATTVTETTTVTPPPTTVTETEPTPTVTVTEYVPTEPTSPTTEPVVPGSPTTPGDGDETTSTTEPTTPGDGDEATPTTEPGSVEPHQDAGDDAGINNPLGSVDAKVLIPALVGVGLIGVISVLAGGLAPVPVPAAPVPAPAPGVVQVPPRPADNEPKLLATTGDNVTGMTGMALLFLLAGAWALNRRRKLS